MNLALPFINTLNIPMAPDSSSRQALLASLMDATDSTVSLEDTKNYMTTHSSLSVFAPEFTVFLGYKNLEFMTDLTDLYDCRESYRYRTISRGWESIPNVFLNMLGATTPDMIKLSITTEHIGTGFTSRIIFVYEERIKGRVVAPFFTISEEGLALQKDLEQDLHQIYAMRGQFKMTKGFMNRWIDFYKDYPEECPFDPQRFAAYWERRPAHLMKLSMVFSASRNNEMVVEVEDFERSLRLLTSTEQKMPLTFAGVGRGSWADIMASVMGFIALKGKITMTDLLNEFYRDIDSEWQMQQIIKTLRKMKYILVDETIGKVTISYNADYVQKMKADNEKENS